MVGFGQVSLSLSLSLSFLLQKGCTWHSIHVVFAWNNGIIESLDSDDGMPVFPNLSHEDRCVAFGRLNHKEINELRSKDVSFY